MTAALTLFPSLFSQSWSFLFPKFSSTDHMALLSQPCLLPKLTFSISGYIYFFSVVEKAVHFQVWIKHYKTEHEKPYALGMEQIQQSHDGDDPATSCLLNPSQIAPSLLEISLFPPLNTLPSIQHQARNKTAVSKSLLAPRPFSTLQSQIHDGWKRPLRSSSPTISPPHHAHWPCPSVLHLHGSWTSPGMWLSLPWACTPCNPLLSINPIETHCKKQAFLLCSVCCKQGFPLCFFPCLTARFILWYLEAPHSKSHRRK